MMTVRTITEGLVVCLKLLTTVENAYLAKFHQCKVESLHLCHQWQKIQSDGLLYPELLPRPGLVPEKVITMSLSLLLVIIIHSWNLISRVLHIPLSPWQQRHRAREKKKRKEGNLLSKSSSSSSSDFVIATANYFSLYIIRLEDSRQVQMEHRRSSLLPLWNPLMMYTTGNENGHERKVEYYLNCFHLYSLQGMLNVHVGLEDVYYSADGIKGLGRPRVWPCWCHLNVLEFHFGIHLQCFHSQPRREYALRIRHCWRCLSRNYCHCWGYFRYYFCMVRSGHFHWWGMSAEIYSRRECEQRLWMLTGSAGSRGHPANT